MSLIVAAGQIIGDRGTYDYWDPSLSLNPGAASQDNRGCAPGWAAIYVEDSITGGTVKVCRRIDEAILGPGGAAIIQEETAPNWTDQAVINVAETSEQIVAGGGQVINALSPALTSTALVLGAIALLLFVWKK
jgi:hypothetical protein